MYFLFLFLSRILIIIRVYRVLDIACLRVAIASVGRRARNFSASLSKSDFTPKIPP